MVVGWESDLQGITKAEAEAWFRKYYGARNLTAVIVGDVDPKTAFPMLEKHLGQIPPGDKPGPVVTVEPPQRAEKRVIMEDPSQPILVVGFHRPDVTDPDDAAYDSLSDILGGGRSSRLYKSLVKEKKLAVAAGASGSLGGEKYPGLFLFFAVPNKGKTNAECEAAVDEEIDKLKNTLVTADELTGVKARAKASFIRRVESNMGLAVSLASSQNLQGDWRKMFTRLDEIDKVTAADIQRIARATFVKSNRTVGVIESAPAGEKP
jgi:predicted Zn-dependent peptidase